MVGRMYRCWQNPSKYAFLVLPLTLLYIFLPTKADRTMFELEQTVERQVIPGGRSAAAGSGPGRGTGLKASPYTVDAIFRHGSQSRKPFLRLGI